MVGCQQNGMDGDMIGNKVVDEIKDETNSSIETYSC
jgi:hypothetical protein